MAEKHGQLVTFPLQCACGHIGTMGYMRWCGACSEAICPDCFPPGEADKFRYRCQRCLDEGRRLLIEIAGEEAGRRESKRYWDRFLKLFFAKEG